MTTPTLISAYFHFLFIFYLFILSKSPPSRSQGLPSRPTTRRPPPPASPAGSAGPPRAPRAAARLPAPCSPRPPGGPIPGPGAPAPSRSRPREAPGSVTWVPAEPQARARRRPLAAAGRPQAQAQPMAGAPWRTASARLWSRAINTGVVIDCLVLHQHVLS